ncbi:hypothetical protein PG991_016031 [Apiospora marii]|uniref:FAD-binding PCMH-type domain-containing protein n=1 Tax=Apiospora marii TaxID=335849 RepID=A0ABR1R0D4_9PEZI
MATLRAITMLQASFSADRVALPATETYNERNGSYLSKLESDISPNAIFLPHTTEEVSQFVKLIGPLVQEGDVKFAIRGAGCQPLPGCANIQGGITLDLSRLVGTTLDETQGTVRIAAGERWGAVYKTVQEKGLAVTGARSGNNGIGGLALSGGLSFFGTREGFISDNVVNYEVVLASGEVVHANRQENADLFVALRGGGNNLGIVTRFGGQIDALMKELNKPDASEETHVMISLFFADQFSKAIGVDGAMGLNQAYYTQEVEKPAVLDPFTNIQPQVEPLNSMRMTNLVAAAEEQAKQAMTGVRCAYMNTTVKADGPTLHAAAKTFEPALEKVRAIDGMVFSFTLQPYPVSLLKRTEPAGGNVLGLNPADGPLVSILILLYWNQQSDDELVLGTARNVIEAIDKDAAARGTLVPYKYLNYAFDFQDPIGSYGQENRKKLQEASRKYDPDGLFQKEVPGGFKLFP